MKDGWQIKPLQELCKDYRQDIVDGPFGSELQRKDYINEGIPVLKIQNVKAFAIELKKMDYVSLQKFQELKRHTYRRGDIVMTKLGSPLGASAIVENLDEGVFVADLVRIRAQLIDTKYLCYHLNSPRTNEFINSMQKGTTRPRVTLSVVRELPITVPPFPEQQHIVRILDEAFEGIATAKANAEKNLQNARALFESYLEAVFSQRGEGWEEKALGDICEVKDGTHYSPKYVATGIPFVTQKNIKKNGLSFEDTKFITKSDHDNFYKRSNVAYGDILISMIGANRGMACIVDDQRIFSIKNVGLVKRSDSINQHFLLYFLKSSIATDYVSTRSKGGAQEFIGLTELRRFPILTTSLPQQTVVVSKLDALREETQRLESIYQKKLAALEELKKSLLHQAFNGEL